MLLSSCRQRAAGAALAAALSPQQCSQHLEQHLPLLQTLLAAAAAAAAAPGGLLVQSLPRRGLHATAAGAAAEESPPGAAAPQMKEQQQQDANAAATDAGDRTSEQQAAAAAQQLNAAARPARAPHISLDDPELNVYLRHNTGFVTDTDRAYSLGSVRALERKQLLELRKALAAQRLGMRDAALAAAADNACSSSSMRQHTLQEQMLERLTAIQDYASSFRQR